jgi:hypothetical protein
MNDHLITFRSVTGAQRAVKVFSEHGIRAPLARTPKTLSENGCSYCVRVREDQCVQAVDLLRDYQIRFSRVYRLGEQLEEVAL